MRSQRAGQTVAEGPADPARRGCWGARWDRPLAPQDPGSAHGPWVVAAFGDRFLALLRVHGDASIEVWAILPELVDWILDMAWLDTKQSTTDTVHVAVALAQGHVEQWSGHGNTWHQTSRTRCEAACILYAAQFAWGGSALLCAAGTVFGQVLLWDPLGTCGQPGRILAVLSGHSVRTLAREVEWRARREQRPDAPGRGGRVRSALP